MELYYEGKKNEEEILKRTKEYQIELFDNRASSMLIKSENFKALSCLLENGYEGKIDLIYIDPPFNTNQQFVVTEDRRQSVSMANDGKLAYNDRFNLEEYLEFIRERTILLHKLLSEEGSLYFHIDTKMGHYCKIILDEIFGKDNFKNDITRIKSNPKNFSRSAYGNEKDVILFYAKNTQKNIWNNTTIPMSKQEIKKRYTKKDSNGFYTTVPLHAPGETKNGITGEMWRGMLPPKGRHWRTDPAEFDVLDSQGRIEWSSTGNPRIKKYAHEHKGKKIQDIWTFKDPQQASYPTQKNIEMLRQIILQSSNTESIVLDCFVGGGTTLVAAEQEGRKWIGIDESEEAILTSRKNLSEAVYCEYSL